MLEINDTQSKVLKVAATGAIIVGGVIWSMTKIPEPLKMKSANYDNQSVIIDDKKFIRSSQFKNPTEVSRGNFKNIDTLYDVFQCGLSHGVNEPCLGYKADNSTNYQWLTYGEVDQNSIKTGAGIIHLLNQVPGQNTRIGIYMKNCVEWVYVEQGCCRYSMVLAPLYDTLGEESCVFVVNHVRCEVVFVDTEKKLDFLIRSRSEMPVLKYIVTSKEIDRSTIEIGAKKGLAIFSFAELLHTGNANPVPLVLPKSDDVSTIVFTSGTTGLPKGCIITHKGLLTSLSSALNISNVIAFGRKKEIHLSFLPLTHLYERLVHILMFMYTGKVAFFSGEIRFLGEEMKILKPTIIFAVPRILNRIYDKVVSIINKRKMIKYLYDTGWASKMKEVERGIIRRNSIWDYIIFRRIQAFLGGDVGIIMVGSAPVSGDVMNFFRAVMGCLVIEGYGQTETTGPLTMTFPGDNEPGHVGVPVPGSLIMLCDVPELDIIVSRDNRGEICAKGNMCIKQYFNNTEMSGKLIDEDGWLHTGDVGLWTEKGQLKIVDRCKHIFKLSQGEYLTPERLENIYSLSTLIAQIFVTGNSLHDFCVAIVIPDIDGWRAIDNNKYQTILDVCDCPQAYSLMLEDMERLGRKNRLFGFEIVRKVRLCSEMMTLENGLLTPTLKLKRTEVGKFFAKEIELMYR